MEKEKLLHRIEELRIKLHEAATGNNFSDPKLLKINHKLNQYINQYINQYQRMSVKRKTKEEIKGQLRRTNSKQYKNIMIPKNAGLQDYQRLLVVAENQIRRVAPILTQYRINGVNAKAKFEDALSTAKVVAIKQYDLRPSHQTLINAYANADEEVKVLKKEWLDAKALETKAIAQMNQLQGMRNTLKTMVRSEHIDSKAYRIANSKL